MPNRVSVAPAVTGRAVVRVAVAVGDPVTAGQPLLWLEAMKMENEIMSPCDGSVKQLAVNKGASVNSGDLLIVIG